MKLVALFVLLAIVVCSEGSDYPTCPPEDGADAVYFADEDCTKFRQCSNGYPYLRDCPDLTYFNPEKNVCDWQSNVQCKGNSS
jgi:hypothetical protein